MNTQTFDDVIRAFSSGSSRRRLLTCSASGLLAALPLAFRGEETAAKKKGKKHKKKLERNAFGCVDVGQPCAGNSANCCSGVCEGAKPKKGKKDASRCVAHNAGICSAETDTCTVGAPVPCLSSNPLCVCTLTTGNAGFCGNGAEPTTLCRVCSKDTDCQAEFGPGAACVIFGGPCTGYCAATGTTACMRPCA